MAVLLFAAAVGIYYESWAAISIVPIMLFLVWLEYWLFSG